MMADVVIPFLSLVDSRNDPLGWILLEALDGRWATAELSPPDCETNHWAVHFRALWYRNRVWFEFTWLVCKGESIKSLTA